MFDKLTYWNLETPPNSDDTVVMAMDWPELADAVSVYYLKNKKTGLFKVFERFSASIIYINHKHTSVDVYIFNQAHWYHKQQHFTGQILAVHCVDCRLRQVSLHL